MNVDNIIKGILGVVIGFCMMMASISGEAAAFRNGFEIGLIILVFSLIYIIIGIVAPSKKDVEDLAAQANVQKSASTSEKSALFTICSNCKAHIPVESKFCPECGEELKTEIVCSNCKAHIPVESKFCPKCGEELKTSIDDTNGLTFSSSTKEENKNKSRQIENSKENLHTNEEDDCFGTYKEGHEECSQCDEANECKMVTSNLKEDLTS